MDTILVYLILIFLLLWCVLIWGSKESFAVLEHLGLDPKSDKISLYILNYKRPHNLELSLPILKSIRYIDEIIISHGSPEGFVEFKGVTNIKDYSNNEKYGAGRRFLVDLNNFKNDRILIMDDDHIVSSSLLEKMLIESKEELDQIYGPYERGCNKDGYEFNPPKERQNVVLTGLALTSKKVIKNFQDHFSEVEAVLTKFNGNGDDLTFNYLFRKYLNKNPKYVKGDYIELDTKGGYSFTRNHNDTRNKICEALNSL